MMIFYLSMIETEEDKRKFERLYLAHKQTMFYAANRILKNEHSAEDAVHGAFMRILNHLEKINETECHKTRAFFVVIVEHIAIDMYRKQRREPEVPYDELTHYMEDWQADSFESEGELLFALKRLPLNYSTVLRLKFAQGYSDTEIAELLHITEENVRQRISRGKKKLSQILAKEGDLE